MLDIADNCGLSRLVTFPTREESRLDLVLTSHSDLISNLHGLDGIGDYSIVSFDLNVSIKVNKKKPRYVYKLRLTDFDAVRTDAEELGNNFFAREPSQYSVEQNWQMFIEGLLEIANKRVPMKKLGSSSDAPWITREHKRLLRKRKRLYNNYKKFGNAADKQKYRRFQKELKATLCKAQDDYIAEILNIDPKSKPKKYILKQKDRTR
ncbi:predicted protein [Nematostella vectensis]|uniref:Uncharacterized protein n=1 Tax=Nematostella vectensis TaxID=45351 RepID=A7SZT8_NEMVE|nr:predicted protein [Nematostella vectensis]|eukprot:XP_001622878.1 predicted protein [Nematostella vectensis]